MKILFLALAACSSFALGIVLALCLWFAAAQNSSMSRSVGARSVAYERSSEFFYYSGWASLGLGGVGACFFLFRAKRHEDDQS